MNALTERWLFKGPQYDDKFPFNKIEFQQGLLQLADGINNLTKSIHKITMLPFDV